MKQQRLRLANGLWVTLTHDPQATRAAALYHLAVGSHHEPEQWPGLAHLFEHVVFAGSESFQQQQRLMSWAQAEGARLNATTLPTATAWFFDVAASKLEAGFARLSDMLARPLLSLEAVEQETAVIDAEFHLLAADADTLCEAALGAAFATPKALKRFHVGNLVSFSDPSFSGNSFSSNSFSSNPVNNNSLALQQALRNYHQHFFNTELLTLWISGPQPLEELAALATRYAEVFAPAHNFQPPNTEPLSLHGQRAFAMKLAGAARLQLSFKLTLARQTAVSLTMLRQLVIDEAQHSLLDTLSERGLCDSLQLMKPYESETEAIVTFEFLLNTSEQRIAVEVNALFSCWLRQLDALTTAQLQHYARLAAEQFSRLSPVDRLRTIAFDFQPIIAFDATLLEDWQKLLPQLTTSNMTRLWVAPEIEADLQLIQGFSLPIKAIPWLNGQKNPPVDFTFYPLGQTPAALNLPREKVILPHHPASQLSTVDQLSSTVSQKPGVLILSPALGHALPPRWAHIIQASLRAIIGQGAHRGASLSFENYQGQWLLQLSGDNDVMLATLDAVIAQLNELSHALSNDAANMLIARGDRQFVQAEQALQTEIAIRCLLNQLPRLLSQKANELQDSFSLPILPWRAALYGGDASQDKSALHDGISRLLSRFPGEINPVLPAALAPRSARASYSFPTTSHDAAVLLFCPLVEQTPCCLAAWQILASLFEPRFFQRLRVELNLGYVVTCRFMQSAGESGILFAVQSPTHSVPQIVEQITQFIKDMSTIVDKLGESEFAAKIADLQQNLAISSADHNERAREQWFREHLYTSALTDESLTSFSIGELQDFYSEMIAKKSTWWWLDNLPADTTAQ